MNHAMGRSDNSAFLERLIVLRGEYRSSADERHGVLATRDAIAYAEAVMTAVELDVEPWLAELEASLVELCRDVEREPRSPRLGLRFASDLWPRPLRPDRPAGAPSDTDES